jgi:hypothetical protein
MSQTHDILIVIDCDKSNFLPNSTQLDGNKAVTMFADATTTIRGGQGTNELWVQVPQGDSLRWRAVAKQYTTVDNQKLHALITTAGLWGGSGANGSNQLDAYSYLTGWFWDTEAAKTGRIYNPTNQSFPIPDPGSDSGSETVSTLNPFPTTTASVNVNFVQAFCHNSMASENRVAYSFTCSIWAGTEPYATVNWDPFVTIIQSNNIAAKR